MQLDIWVLRVDFDAWILQRMTIDVEDDEAGLSIANVAVLGLFLGISLLLVFFV